MTIRPPVLFRPLLLTILVGVFHLTTVAEPLPPKSCSEHIALQPSDGGKLFALTSDEVDVLAMARVLFAWPPRVEAAGAKMRIVGSTDPAILQAAQRIMLFKLPSLGLMVARFETDTDFWLSLWRKSMKGQTVTAVRVLPTDEPWSHKLNQIAITLENSLGTQLIFRHVLDGGGGTFERGEFPSPHLINLDWGVVAGSKSHFASILIHEVIHAIVERRRKLGLPTASLRRWQRQGGATRFNDPYVSDFMASEEVITHAFSIWASGEEPTEIKRVALEAVKVAKLAAADAQEFATLAEEYGFLKMGKMFVYNPGRAQYPANFLGIRFVRKWKFSGAPPPNNIIDLLLTPSELAAAKVNITPPAPNSGWDPAASGQQGQPTREEFRKLLAAGIQKARSLETQATEAAGIFSVIANDPSPAQLDLLRSLPEFEAIASEYQELLKSIW